MLRPLLFSLVFLLLPTQVFAHAADTGIKLEINGERGQVNEITSAIPDNKFTLTEEVFPQFFQPDTKLTLALVPDDGNELPPGEITWETGELAGTFTGASVTITPQKTGSFPVFITFPLPNGQTTEHSALINIAPKNYKAPGVTVLANGREVKPNTTTDIDLARDLKLEAVTDSPGKKSFVWNFDNGVILEGQEIIYETKDEYLLTPILRVIDENGVSTDTQFRFKNDTSTGLTESYTPLLLGFTFVLILLLLGFFFLKRFLKNRLGS